MSPFWSIVSRSGDTVTASIKDEIVTPAEPFIKAIGDTGRIELYLDCIGGDSATAWKIHEALAGRDVTCRVKLASSAGAIIALAARRVLIQPAGHFMIHRSMIATIGSAPSLRAEANSLDALDERCAAMLQERTKQPAETVATWLDGGEHWFAAPEAVAAALADEILPATPSIEEALARAQGQPEEQATGDEVFTRCLLGGLGPLRVRHRGRFLAECMVTLQRATTQTIEEPAKAEVKVEAQIATGAVEPMRIE